MRLLFSCSLITSLIFMVPAAYAQRATITMPANAAAVINVKKLSVEQKAPAPVRRYNNQRQNINIDDDFAPVGEQNTSDLFERLMQMNRIDPQQNPQYDGSKNVLRKKLVSRKNRVLGDVADLLLDRDGHIRALSVVLNRLQKYNKIALSYADIGAHPTSSGYKISYSKDQMKDLYPTFLAGIETAAGASGDVYSLVRIKRAALYTAQGRKIGAIKDVLFTNEGSRAAALYIDVSASVVRSKALAIPFSALRFKEKGNALIAVLPEERAQVIFDYIRAVK